MLAKYKVPKRKEASNEAIKELESAVGFTLPEDYKSFLINYQSFEDLVGEEYVSLWDLNELKQQNEEYLILKNLPNTIGIGSNRAGELIALERK
ncbi:SMI1/KNR4 family protein [Pontibacter sp. 172403-2]|uniref:SMI1/KNR4 family protein n=1 Tax=Pontibacter rufus TaxID=2791028 RepID=UPI0018AFCF99|nr:SMI1/KNR4 family protein [Pontibacter sp. 172403-2]MBF9254825.1 SMI1/KNR4 family protein [Pontibacter sp. 172403-2]